MNYPTVPKPETPALLDKVIVQIQDALKANLSWLNYSFGRAQKLVSVKDGKQNTYPGVHVGSGTYLNVFPDDNYKNFSFFIIEDPEKVGTEIAHRQNSIAAKYALIVWVNLNSIYAGAVDRNAEAIKEQILNLLTKTMVLSSDSRITVTEIFDQGENIYKGYSTKEIESQFLMQPYCGFRFEGDMTYTKLC